MLKFGGEDGDYQPKAFYVCALYDDNVKEDFWEK